MPGVAAAPADVTVDAKPSQLAAAPAAVTVDAKPSQPATCPSGHSLLEFQTQIFGFGCDVCGSLVVPEGATMFGCRSCNFDVCQECIVDYARVEHRALEAFRACDQNGDKVLTFNSGKIRQFITLLLDQFGLSEYSEDEIFNLYQRFDADFSQDLDEQECVRLAHAVRTEASSHQDQ